MKLLGKRLLLWGGLTWLILQIVPSLLGGDQYAAVIGLLITVLDLASFSAGLAGLVIYLTTRSEQQAPRAVSRTKFWTGLILAVCGLALPGFFVYEMLFVPGGADAIFIVMMIGPIGLLLLILGLRMALKNRK